MNHYPGKMYVKRSNQSILCIYVVITIIYIYIINYNTYGVETKKKFALNPSPSVLGVSIIQYRGLDE